MCKYVIIPKITLKESRTTANWADLRTWHAGNGAKVRNGFLVILYVTY